MTDSKEFELRIRAKLDGVKDLSKVADAIAEVEKAIESQSAAAKRGENVIDELKGSMAALAVIQKDIAANASLKKDFEAMGREVAKLEGRLGKAVERFTALDSKLTSSGKLTDKQRESYDSLQKSIAGYTTQINQQKQQLAALAPEYAKVGVDVSNLAGFQERLAATSARLAVAVNKAGDAQISYAADVRKAREAQKEAARQEADSNLSKIAQDAQDAAKGYSTLASAADNLKLKQTSLRDAVNDLLDPSRKVNASLTETEAKIKELSSSIWLAAGPVKDYDATMKALVQTQKALQQQAGMVDGFLREEAALKELRAEFDKAAADIDRYAAELRKGGSAAEQFVKPLAEAKAKLDGLSAAIAKQNAVVSRSDAALRAAGIATNDLAGAQQRMIGAANSATGAVRQLDKAVERFGKSQADVDREAQKSAFFGSGGRTTLSVSQRVIGQIYSLTAAYVGLFGVLRLGQGSVQSVVDRDAVKGRLSIAFGTDPEALQNEYDYVKKVSDQIGVDFGAASQGFAKIAGDIKLNNKPIEEARYLFETFSKVARVAELTAEEQGGVFRAIGQTYSVGKVQAEELNQLSERIPAVRALAQQALKDVFPDLQKALEQGLVTAEYMPIIAQAYEKAIGGSISMATMNLSAQQARLNNELRFFREQIADSGFIKSYTDAIQEITSFLKTEDGRAFAVGIGEAFKMAADAAVFLAKNFDDVKFALASLATLWLGSKLVGGIALLASGLNSVAGGVGFLTGRAIALVSALGPIGPALASIAAGFAGWQIGTWAREKFAEVRQAGTWMVTGVAQGFAYLTGAFEIAMAALPPLAQNAMANFLNIVTFAVRKSLGIFSSFASAVGLDSLAKGIDTVVASITVGYADIGAATAQARADMAREVAGIKAIRQEMLAADLIDPKKATAQPSGRSGLDSRRLDGRLNAATDPRSLARGGPAIPMPTPGKASDAEIKKRENQIEALRKSLETLETRIDRAQNDSLKAQLDAIDSQYAQLGRDIKAVGDPELLRRYTTLVAELRTSTIDKFNKKRVADELATLNKIEDLEAAAGKKQKFDVEARTQAIKTQYADLYRELERLRALDAANGMDTSRFDASRARIDAAVNDLAQAEKLKYLKDELNRREEAGNTLLESRKARVDDVNAAYAAMDITREQADQQIKAIYEETAPKITEVLTATREWAVANAALFANTGQQDAFIAKLDAIIGKVNAIPAAVSNVDKAWQNFYVEAVGKGLNLASDALEQMLTGQASVAQGFRGMLAGFAQFAAEFLRKIALMIIQQQIFNALKNSGNPVLAAVGAAGLNVPVQHSGGMVGGTSNRNRSVSPAWFANAPRYHAGGLMGIKADEYPTILQKGEEVLAANSPRNIVNGGAAAGGGAAASPGVRVVLVDDRARVPEAMNSPEGEQVIVQAIRKNLPTIRSMMGA